MTVSSKHIYHRTAIATTTACTTIIIGKFWTVLTIFIANNSSYADGLSYVTIDSRELGIQPSCNTQVQTSHRQANST